MATALWRAAAAAGRRGALAAVAPRAARSAPVAGRRGLSAAAAEAEAAQGGGGGGSGVLVPLALAGAAGAGYYFQFGPGAAPKEVDFAEVRSAIAAILDDDAADYGSYGPLLVRLAWHSSGTYDHKTGVGGSNGGLMRFEPECKWGANAGLDIARDLLEPIKKQFGANLTYGDLYTLSGVVAIEEMGGPVIPWAPGRVDAADSSEGPQEENLPDAAQGAAHLRDVFYRQGFNDQEIVALSGAHALGMCHTDRSGFKGPWTYSPTTFSNSYYTVLMNTKWKKKKWDGPVQYKDPKDEIMMLPTDMELLWDRKLYKWTKVYAKDEAQFFKDFAAAFGKMLANGVPAPAAASPKTSA